MIGVSCNIFIGGGKARIIVETLPTGGASSNKEPNSVIASERHRRSAQALVIALLAH